MTTPFYIVNAFTTKPFGGNPAVVCPLKEWRSDDDMQKMAAQHNLSETAFIVETPNTETDFHIRWFTPTCEVDLCGHATLASCQIIFDELGFEKDSIKLQSKVGILTIHKEADGKIFMDFPKGNIQKSVVLGTFHAVFGSRPLDAYECPIEDGKQKDLVLVFENVAQVTDADINFKAMHTLTYRCIIVTAKSAEVDFVCRVFAPNVGIDEDPVTGSAFTVLSPIWSQRLAEEGTTQTEFSAKQVSARGGEVWSELKQDRVVVAGYSSLYGKGELFI